MKIRKRKLLIGMVTITAALLYVFSSAVFGAERQKQFDPQTKAKMEKLLNKAMEESRSPGALVGVWAPGEGTWIAARGKANLKTGQPAEIKDKVRIGSITKTFVAMAVLQLVDEGKIGLDDPIEKYLPFVRKKTGITVRQLLNHSSGLFDPENSDPGFRKEVDANPSRALSPREIVERALRHAPYNKPGEGAHYSNANYKALGLIVEKVTGKDLGTVLRNRIFDRLGLKHTVFATKPDIEGKHMHGYAVLPGRTIDMTVRPDIWELWASGNIVSTLEDLKKWAEALGEGTLLSRKTYGEMTDWIDIQAALPGKFKYGLGVDLVGKDFIGHSGAVDGYYARIANNPKTGATIVLLFNNLSSTKDVLVYENFLHGLIDILQPSVSDEQFTPVLTSFAAPPLPARLSDGKIHVLYELVLTNAANIPFTIEKLEAVNPQDRKSPIASFDRDYIAGHSRFPGAGARSTVLGPGQSGFIRINLSFDSLNDVPASIGHVLSVSSKKPWGPSRSKTFVERVATAAIPRETGPVIGPPLKGGRWVSAAVGGEYYHRNTVMPLNGKWVAPERWAVDWVQLDKKNRLVAGNPMKLESYPQYGREVIAVADGTVLQVRNDQPDQVPGRKPVGMPLEDICGNFVLQDIGDGYSALYAHMIPGSVRVKPGDKVRRGQVLGLLGNSGNTDAPHLHFQIVKGKTCLASNGVPYVIDSFELKGQSISSDYLESMLKSGKPVEVRPVNDPGKRTREMPADAAVVDFPQ